jgi:RNA polymerase sigma-70 factor (ECF subfamily)
MTSVATCDLYTTGSLGLPSRNATPQAAIAGTGAHGVTRTDPATQHLLAAARGDREAFARLYACSAPRLFGVAFRIVRDRARAEDVLQDAFVTIWERAGVFSPQRSSAMTWMTTIVHNRSLDRVRSSRREPRADENDDGASRLDREASPCRSPEDAQVFAESSRHVRNALQSLPGHYRQALMLAYGHGCSHSEVAASMGVPVGTAKSWVRRGLSELRSAFACESAATGRRQESM